MVEGNKFRIIVVKIIFNCFMLIFFIIIYFNVLKIFLLLKNLVIV